MNPPKISIVTPSFNQGDFIRDTLHSVMNQEYQNVEHIVVDAGSTDGTIDILERYEDEYPLRWISEPDDGLADGINKGFRMAEGDIIGWLNSDDVYFHTNVFSRIASNFSKTNADVIFGDTALIDRAGLIYKFISYENVNYEAILNLHISLAQQVFYTSEVVDAHEMNTDLEYCMDYEYLLRALQEFEYEHVRDVIAAFRKHSNQKTTSNIDASNREADEVAARYGRLTGRDLELYKLKAIPRIKIPMILRSLEHSYRFAKDSPPLAFHGKPEPLWKLCRNRLPEGLVPTEQTYVD